MKNINPSAPTPFVVFTMPLSSDAWIASWLKCQHCGLLTSASMEAWFKSLSILPYGTVESSMPIIWRVLKQRLPNVRIAVVMREIAEIVQEYGFLGKWVDSKILQEQYDLLEVIVRTKGIMRIDLPLEAPFQQLKKLHAHLRPGEDFNQDWLDEAFETRVPNHFLQPNPCTGAQALVVAKIQLEALAESAKLGGNSNTLWLN